jgi:hypothetical protein
MPINVNGDTISTSSFGSTSLINNVVLNGLQCYLDAGDINSYPGSGTSWYDMSGNGRHATWNATPSWTSNGSASYFSPYGNMARGVGSDRYGIDNTTGYSIIWLSQNNSGTANAAFKFYSSLETSYNRGIFVHPSWTANDTLYFDQGGCCGSDTRTQYTFGTSNFTSWRVWAVTRNGNDRRIYMNGVQYAQNTAAAADIRLDATQLFIGGDNNYSSATSSNWDAKLNLFMVYNRGLTSAEIYQNYFVQKSKFSI